MGVSEDIIKTIYRNRISTSEVSDCLGKAGVIPGVTAINYAKFAVGPIRYVYAYKCSNWELHEQLEAVQPGEVIIVDAIECEDYAVFGSLVAKFCCLYREVASMVVLGLVRDVHTLRKENYPIWCQGITPKGCFNIKNEEKPSDTILKKRMEPYHGAIAVCDDSGVVVIPKNKINDKFVRKLHFVEVQEDAWFHSIDTDNYSTYETVCLKRYLDKGSIFHKYDELKK